MYLNNNKGDDLDVMDDVIVVCSEDRNGELERWRRALEDRGIEVSRKRQSIWIVIFNMVMMGIERQPL